KGRTVAFSSPTTGPFTWDRILKGMTNGQMTTADYNSVYMGYADMIAALANKAVDGAFMVEPQMVQAIAAGAAVRIPPQGQQFYDLSGFSKDYYQQDAVVQFAAGFAKDTPDVGKRFMVGYLKAVRDYNDAFRTGKDKADIIKILSDSTGTDAGL